MPRAHLFSAIQDEAPFLLEWIAYHKAVGFDAIHIAPGPSADTTVALCEALEAAGEIALYPNWAQDPGQTRENAAQLWNAARPWEDGDWLLWLDGDEFLNVHAGRGRVSDATEAIGSRDGMFVQWRVMGASGCVGLPDRQLAHDMVGASKATGKINLGGKTLWRASDKFRGFAQVGVQRPLVDPEQADDVTLMLSNAEDFVRSIGVNKTWLSGADAGSSRRATRIPVQPKLAQINRYAVRSRDAIRLKPLTPHGAKVVERASGRKKEYDRLFNEMERSSHVDHSILRHLENTDRELDRLMSLPDVARLHRKGVAIAVARIDPNPAEPETPELTLPPAEALLVRAELGKCLSYLEYGGGGSTLMAADMGVGHIWCVESDPQWAQMLRAVVAREVPQHDNVHVHTSYIGPTRAWALPKDDSGWRHYIRYPMGVWDLPGFTHPDLVLIDGRFRAGCFLACYLKHDRPMRVLFDDYKQRPDYHRVEKLVPLREMVGRMAVFDFDPDQKDLARGVEMLELFNDVH